MFAGLAPNACTKKSISYRAAIPNRPEDGAKAPVSTRLMTNGNGEVVRRYDYLPFGEEIPSGSYGRGSDYGQTLYPNGGNTTGDTATLKFTGKERDTETGLDYFGARYFSGAQGRFTSPDWSSTPMPVPYAMLTDPQTFNLYSYVRNNPFARADVDGHCMQAADNATCLGSEVFDPPSPPQPLTDQEGQKSPTPAPTDDKGKLVPPPVPVPGAPDLGWKWNPNAQNPRGGTWGPKGWRGPNPPSGSWDPDGHWDINGGKGQPVDHYDPNGKPITPDQAHPGNIQLPSARQIGIGFGSAAAGYLIYRGIRMLSSVVIPVLWPTIPINVAIP